jgi:phosphoribosylformylglycinamidine cyclo-ligase
MVGSTPSRYRSLGVDVGKEGIEALRSITCDLFPSAFCSVVRHPSDPARGIILHEDGAGTKPIVSYICYRETGEAKWFQSLATDVVAMNIDDVVCVGGKPIAFSDYIALNPFTVRKQDLLGWLARGFDKTFATLKSLEIDILFSGGETADLPDIVRTFDVSGTVYGEVELDKAITGAKISPGDVIVGLRSGGRCSYEEGSNSGLMCNGITLARHSLLRRDYLRKYPEIGSKEVKGYFGRFTVDTKVPDLGMSVGEALLSPARIYLPIALKVLKSVDVKGMVHNTGGGMTKCKRLGRKIRYLKDSLPEPDPIFRLIRRESKADWREMYQDFNMGVGFEVIVGKGDEDAVIDASEKFGVGAQVIGRCERFPSGNAVLIRTGFGKFEY